MDKHPLNRIQPLVQQANRILLIGRRGASIDECAALSLLAHLLAKQQKQVRCVIPDLNVWPEPLRTIHAIEPTIGPFRTLEIHLPVDRVPLSEVAYTIENNALRLTLIPKDGMWNTSEVHVRSGQPRFDLLITIQASKESLAELLPNDPEWMHAIPSISLSTDPSSPVWSSLPLLFVTKTGLAEELALWLKDEDPSSITLDIAHNALTGIIASSQGFRGPRVQSSTFHIASDLVERGADRQDIIHRLWRTVPVSALNLWGRAMMRLAPHPTLPIATTLLTAHDFLQAKTDAKAIPELGASLLERLPETQAVLVLFNDASITRVRLFARRPLEADLIAGWFHGKGAADEAEWSMSTIDLLEAQREIFLILERELPRLSISR